MVYKLEIYWGLAVAGALLFLVSTYATDDDLFYAETFCVFTNRNMYGVLQWSVIAKTVGVNFKSLSSSSKQILEKFMEVSLKEAASFWSPPYHFILYRFITLSIDQQFFLTFTKNYYPRLFLVLLDPLLSSCETSRESFKLHHVFLMLFFEIFLSKISFLFTSYLLIIFCTL